MALTAPIDVEEHDKGIIAHDDIVILDDTGVGHDVSPAAGLDSVANNRDPVMWIVYLGVVSLLAIVVVAAILAL